MYDSYVLSGYLRKLFKHYICDIVDISIFYNANVQTFNFIKDDWINSMEM